MPTTNTIKQGCISLNEEKTTFISRSLEMYMHDMVVNSADPEQHIQDFERNLHTSPQPREREGGIVIDRSNSVAVLRRPHFSSNLTESRPLSIKTRAVKKPFIREGPTFNTHTS
ncbi:hypothetical protein CR513_20878, partial [Mucuna pruriens]